MTRIHPLTHIVISSRSQLGIEPVFDVRQLTKGLARGTSANVGIAQNLRFPVYRRGRELHTFAYYVLLH